MRHSEGTFPGLNGLALYFQRWLPAAEPKAVLLVAHGFAEHSGRYGNVVNYFVPREYAVYALDHRGHGRSEGDRVHVDHYDEYLADLKTFFDLVRSEQPGRKIFLVGHSMGASIGTAYAARHQAELAGVILSGGGINVGEPPPRPADFDLSATLSRDPAVVEAYRKDPLVFRGESSTRRVEVMAEMRRALPAAARRITLPILILAGAASPLGDGARSQTLYDTVSSPDKTLKLYEELMHEIFNEPEHLKVMADIDGWLTPRL